MFYGMQILARRVRALDISTGVGIAPVIYKCRGPIFVRILGEWDRSDVAGGPISVFGF